MSRADPVALPIDPVLPEVVRALAAGPAVVLEAPPGAGKTTRVPRALDDAGLVEGRILVVEPRRLAARLAARRVAEERGEQAGASVGYQVRFDEQVGPGTRIAFVTDGLLLRRLLDDPRLDGVGAVIFDEFHERRLAGDLGLALCRRLAAARPGFKLAAMSATLDAAPVAAYLGCPAVRSEGRRFPVAVSWAERPAGPDRRLADEVGRAVRQLLHQGLDGDVLCFLPGAAEIRRAAERLAPLAKEAALDLTVLHGDLSLDEQSRAVRPGPRRKVILSTNVAETSITVEGVVAVVDSGLVRSASHSPWSGLPLLRLRNISRASAEQRAGRAGRLRPGRCVRLYTRHEHDGWPAYDAPEVRRLDLAEAVLLLAESGVADPARFDWFEPPPPEALDAARALLERLGALAGGALTPLGRRMARLPLHPRLARLVAEGERRGVAREAAAVAALLADGPIARAAQPATESGPSDLLADLEHLEEARRLRFDAARLRGLGLDAGAARAVDRARRQLEGQIDARAPRPADADEALGLCVLAAFPDRVARRRRPHAPELLLAGGGTAVLGRASRVSQAELLVAVDVEERGEAGTRGVVTVRAASQVEPEWLLELHPDRLVSRDEAVWNEAAGRVEIAARLVYDELVLEERRRAPASETERSAAGALLADKLRRMGGPAALGDAEALQQLRGRVAVLAQALPELGWRAFDDAALDEELAALCADVTSLDELRGGALLDRLRARLPGGAHLVDELAPERVALGRGFRARVTYPPGEAPFVAARMQDFFGMTEAPRIARGRVTLLVHLLAPNQRAVQVTADLAGFWTRHYPALRKQLMRRYPRHAWPEDPLA